jgi:hypothetical protein
MNKSWIFLALMLGLLLGGCKKTAETTSVDDGVGTGNLATWNDPNFEIITVGAYNYTDYDIYDIYLLPLDKNDIKYAGSRSGVQATQRSEKVWNASSSGPALAWDLRWKAPHKFKIWWLRSFDKKLEKESDNNYDMYTNPKAQPGSAWCESEVEIKETYNELYGQPYPERKRNELDLYFYPNGTVQGHLEYGIDSEIKIADITKRDELPTLKGRACIKEVPNPYYGKPRPKRYTY